MSTGFGCGIVILAVHGIGRVELGVIIIVVADMVFEISGANQKITVIGLACIPGGVQIVVQIVDPGNVPAVGATAVTGDEPGIHPQLQGQSVQQQGIALAYRSTVHQRGITGVLECIAVVIQVCVVVGNVGADVIIDAAQALIVSCCVQFQGIQQLSYFAVYGLFLFGGGVVIDGQSQRIQIGCTIMGAFQAKTHILIVPSQIVAFSRNSGVGEGDGKNLVYHKGLEFFSGVDDALTGKVKHGIGVAIFHNFPNSLAQFLQRTKIHGIFGGDSIGKEWGRDNGGRKNVLIEGVDMMSGDVNILGRMCGRGEQTGTQQGDDHCQGQQQRSDFSQRVHSGPPVQK